MAIPSLAVDIRTTAPQTIHETAVDERRCDPRSSRALCVKLLPLGVAVPVACRVRNMSESGMYLLMPEESSVHLGERCVLGVQDESGAEALASLKDEECFATVVRTELLRDRAGQKQFGIAVRFDQPMYF